MSKFVVTDVFGKTVVGSFSAWDHVVNGHPEMADKLELVKQAISAPKSMHETSTPARRLIRSETITSGFWSGSFIKVLVNYTNSNSVGFLITAYLDTLEPKGKQIWP